MHREFVGVPRGKVVECSPQPTGTRSLPVGKPQPGHDPGQGGRLPLGKDRQPRFEGRFVERLVELFRKKARAEFEELNEEDEVVKSKKTDEGRAQKSSA
jgi:hypothetical protein